MTLANCWPEDSGLGTTDTKEFGVTNGVDIARAQAEAIMALSVTRRQFVPSLNAGTAPPTSLLT